jgi:colanic acid/amylovoran biosynthesis glycosyltransferase
MNKPHILYILSQFPEVHETFIVRELREILNRKFSFKIISLKKCKDSIIYPEAASLLKFTSYPNQIDRLFSVVSVLFFVLVHPINFFLTFLILIKDNYHSFSYLLKSIVVLPKATLIAWRIRNEQNIAIHAHWATIPTTCAWIVSRLAKKPYIFTAHAWDIFLHPGNLSRLIEDSTNLITCTNYNRNYLIENLGQSISKKVNVIHHGIELFRFNRNGHPKSKQFVIMAVGRLVPQKGFDVLIKACEFLKKKEIDFQCCIIGAGPLENELKELSLINVLTEQILFLGQLPHNNVLEWMNKADVFVAPSVIAPNSDRDGIPNVILEAMALKLPVVGSKVSGIPEIVIENETGLLVESGDPQSLFLALKKLNNNLELREKLSKNGRRLIEQKFDIRINMNQLEDIYSQIPA